MESSDDSLKGRLDLPPGPPSQPWILPSGTGSRWTTRQIPWAFAISLLIAMLLAQAFAWKLVSRHLEFFQNIGGDPPQVAILVLQFWNFESRSVIGILFYAACYFAAVAVYARLKPHGIGRKLVIGLVSFLIIVHLVLVIVVPIIAARDMIERMPHSGL